MSNFILTFLGIFILTFTEELINYLENNYQLGLYNEGYRRVLFFIIREIIKDKKTMKKSFILIKKLEIFIEKYILKRTLNTEYYRN